MTLHNAVADALAKRREDIVADLNNTQAAITHVRTELERALDAEHRLLADMRAIDDAVELLTTIANKEGT